MCSGTSVSPSFGEFGSGFSNFGSGFGFGNFGGFEFGNFGSFGDYVGPRPIGTKSHQWNLRDRKTDYEQRLGETYFESITAQDEFLIKSFEELRVEDLTGEEASKFTNTKFADDDQVPKDENETKTDPFVLVCSKI